MDNRHDRERLAEASFRKKAAQHKGRPHEHAWKKRLKAKQSKASALISQMKRDARARTLKNAVREYWLGLRKDHP